MYLIVMTINTVCWVGTSALSQTLLAWGDEARGVVRVVLMAALVSGGQFVELLHEADVPGVRSGAGGRSPPRLLLRQGLQQGAQDVAVVGHLVLPPDPQA